MMHAEGKSHFYRKTELHAAIVNNDLRDTYGWRELELSPIILWRFQQLPTMAIQVSFIASANQITNFY